MSLSRKSKRFVLKTERSDYGKAVRRAYERCAHNPLGGGKYMVLICVKRTK